VTVHSVSSKTTPEPGDNSSERARPLTTIDLLLAWLCQRYVDLAHIS
jgi:hypothetical protein